MSAGLIRPAKSCADRIDKKKPNNQISEYMKGGISLNLVSSSVLLSTGVEFPVRSLIVGRCCCGGGEFAHRLNGTVHLLATRLLLVLDSENIYTN